MVQAILIQFISEYLDPKRPVLLALSGGPDSMMLFHWLRTNNIPFAAAHVDHRWRAESSSEAMQLRQVAEKEGVAFHLRELDPKRLQGNLEDACRDERLRFFRELCQKEGYQGVILGHHQNDQAETVLKRVLEGAHGVAISGMKKISNYEGLTLFRPLLEIPKAELLRYLTNYGVAFFEDRTNSDNRYLRGRMREKIFPALEEAFGKKIAPPLCRIANEAAELNEYLDERIRPFLQKKVVSPFGASLDSFPDSLFEVKHLIRVICGQQGLSLSRSALDCAAHHLHEKSANRQISCGSSLLQIDRGSLFLVSALPECVQEPISLEVGSFFVSGWQITVSEGQEEVPTTDWRAFWRDGKARAVLPKDSYRLGAPAMQSHYPGSSAIRHFWTDKKVPAFIRRAVPLIWQNGEIAHEFLTGTVRKAKKNPDRGFWSITLSARPGS